MNIRDVLLLSVNCKVIIKSVFVFRDNAVIQFERTYTTILDNYFYILERLFYMS